MKVGEEISVVRVTNGFVVTLLSGPNRPDPETQHVFYDSQDLAAWLDSDVGEPCE